MTFTYLLDQPDEHDLLEEGHVLADVLLLLYALQDGHHMST